MAFSHDHGGDGVLGHATRCLEIGFSAKLVAPAQGQFPWVFGMQLAHLGAGFRIGCAVGKFHQALEGNADAFAAVVAGYTGFMRNAG